MKTSQFIRNAKRHLWNGHGNVPEDKNVFVCGCLHSENYDGQDTWVAYDKACAHVRRLLNGHSHLPSWITDATGTPMYIVFHDKPKLQDTRLAWMDDMADWFEKQGD